MTTDEVILGIDFGGTKVALGLAGRDGKLLATSRLDTDAAAGAEQVVTRALSRARQLLAEAGARLSAVGVVSPGIVLPDRILLAPNVPGWEGLRLRELVVAGFSTRLESARFGAVPVLVGTDVKAAALAEWKWGALSGADPAVFVSLGTGIGAAVVLGGQVLAGANGAAGEIGYNLRSPQGTEGFAGGAAPLEEAVGGRGLGERASALFGRPVSAGELFALARDNAEAKELVTAAVDELSLHVANLAIAIDAQRIAIGGGMVRSADVLLPALRDRLTHAVPFPPELVAATFDQDGALLGAIALALAG
jgi:glucokinase